jgi:signal transduction histidine kinase
MNLGRIKILGIAVPTAGLFGFELFRHFVLQPAMGESNPHLAEHIVAAFVLSAGVVGFAIIIFRLLDRLHDQLLALNEAGIAVTADLSVESVLGRVVELARTVTGAAYASVQVDPQSVPTVTSGEPSIGGERLVLPIVMKKERLGELVLAGPSGRRFRDTERAALEIFATQAGVAIENAALFEQVQELVTARERIRIGMDLHDGVTQELFALRLKVEDAAQLAPANVPEATRLLHEVEEALRSVIGQLRTYVYDLRGGDASVDLRPALKRLVGEFPSGPPAIALRVGGEPRLPASKAANVLYIVREAVANASRHAEAAHVRLRVQQAPGTLIVLIQDDGRGFDVREPTAGLGLRDMRERAAWCHGSLEIRSVVGEGASVRLTVPLDASPVERPKAGG